MISPAGVFFCDVGHIADSFGVGVTNIECGLGTGPEENRDKKKTTRTPGRVGYMNQFSI